MITGDTVVATNDGGRSWISAPADQSGATLVILSCPVAADCTGLAQLNGMSYAVVSDLARRR